MNDETPGQGRSHVEAEIAQLRQQLAVLEQKLAAMTPAPAARWWPARFYLAYHVVVGMLLGLGAAAVSLLFNVIGSLVVDQHPLQLIRVFLTFPMGAKALTMEDGFTLSAGCFLYLSTGMAFGALLHVLLMRYFERQSFALKAVVGGVLGLMLWLVLFYGVLSWLQPLLFGGSWILQQIPPWVAAATHLVFAWSLLLFGVLGRFEPPEPARAS